ncbi:hypothetical protein [Saccharopolyspora shandongensis]|uniref:hypothetical protein n=1 Tax=Saccharopolyspora shandongensis TaxID=418495 RepID=UPI0015A5AD15|nr:hypothetical protein [Saccharopolyspora shandongensis]
MIWLVDVHRAREAEGFVRSDVVEHLAVVLGLDGEGLAVADLEPVEVVVFQRPERAFADGGLELAEVQLLHLIRPRRRIRERRLTCAGQLTSLCLIFHRLQQVPSPHRTFHSRRRYVVAVDSH